jgi:NAD(P)-dependent dehydrogenase (short-subunit alcohol dehydrogenase family)
MASISCTPTTGVIVTGAASGIGRASALALAEAGRPIAAWDLDEAAAKETAAEAARLHGVASTACGIDVTNHAAFDAAIDVARTALGSIGGLVHAAGVSRTESIADIDAEKWDFVLNVNLRAHALLSHALLPDLRKNPDSAIVGIASINAILGNAVNPAYCASKAGLLGLTRSLADLLGPDGVRANAVCPGYVRTPMLQPRLDASPALAASMIRSTMLGRLAEPDEIGKVVRFLLSTDASYITGAEIVVDGGVIRSQH